MARGGKRTPSNPYQQAGPGALSKRTDGKPGERVVPSGGPYGARKQVEQVNAQAPQVPQGQPVAAPATPPIDVFGPTEFPDEPITAGVPVGPGPGPDEVFPDTDGDLLAAVIRVYPTAALQRLVEWEARNGA